jgi:signal transduction histidine kinase
MTTLFLLVLLPILTGLATNELHERCPSISVWIISQAVKILPVQGRGRYHEEWLAHLDECPTKLGKLYHAIGCLLGAYAISRALRSKDVASALAEMDHSIERLSLTIRDLRSSREQLEAQASQLAKLAERYLEEKHFAEFANKLKTDLVHHVSYEMRSPLTNIIGFIQLLGDGSTGPLNEKQREYAGYALKSSAALLAIVNDIFDLAMIDGGAELQLEEVDIKEMIGAASEGLQDHLSDAAIDLNIVLPDNIGTFWADGKRVRQILFNLLSNAIGFSEPGQTVTLAALRRPKQIVFRVSDPGRGIPPEIVDKVFDRFESHTVGSRHRGAGLGLSLARSFVELHGGTILIDSTPGEGTMVTCIFPVAELERSDAP